MNVFEKSQKYEEVLQKMWAETEKIKDKISEEQNLAQKALEEGDADGFFDHSSKRAIAEKRLAEINSIPCNATGVSPDEVAAAWNEHKEVGAYRKQLEAVCAAHNAFVKQIREFKKAYSAEVDAVEQFRSLAGRSGCGKELLDDMKRPRAIRWDLLEKCTDRGYFVINEWLWDTACILTPEQVEM